MYGVRGLRNPELDEQTRNAFITKFVSEVASSMARMMPESARGWVAWMSPGLMILVGAILFFIPAPPTSLIGIALIIVGAILWLVDYFGGETRGGGRMRGSRGEEREMEAE